VAASLTIEYRDGQYFVKGSDTASDTFCVRKGAPVTFTGSNLWVASDPHPIHSDLSGFDAKGAKESYTYTFDTPGEWGFHNHLRASDTGTIIVVE
jgi:plastocyanin